MNDQGMLTNEARLTEAVSAALDQDKTTAPFNIDVAVLGSTVNLTGEVASDEAKHRAEQIAKSINGVIAVTNELVVRSGGGPGLFRTTARDDDAPAAPAGGVPLAGAVGGVMGSGGGTQGGAAAGAGSLAALGATESKSPDDADRTTDGATPLNDGTR